MSKSRVRPDITRCVDLDGAAPVPPPPAETLVDPDNLPPAITVLRTQLPRADRERLLRLKHIAAVLIAEPAVYHLAPERAAAFAQLVDTFDAAAERLAIPGQRTAPAFEAKNRARDAAHDAYRELAGMIHHHPGIPLEAKLALGWTQRQPKPRVLSAPETAPRLTLRYSPDGRHELHFADERTPDRRGKPHGAAGLEVWSTLADGPAGQVVPARPAVTPEPVPEAVPGAVPGALPGVRHYLTRSPSIIDHPPEHLGRWATYRGRWMTATGKPGPWSEPVRGVVAAGTVPDSGSMGAEPRGDG